MLQYIYYGKVSHTFTMEQVSIHLLWSKLPYILLWGKVPYIYYGNGQIVGPSLTPTATPLRFHLFIPPGRPGGYCGLGRALLQCAETTVGEETRETAEERAAVAMKRVARSDSRRIKNFRNQIFSQPKLAYVRRNSKKPANQKNLGPNLTPKFLAKISP